MPFRRKLFLTVLIFLSSFNALIFADKESLEICSPQFSKHESGGIILLDKKQFAVFYNTDKLIPELVCWHLDSSDLGNNGRSNNFRPDPELPETCYAVVKQDYQFLRYGFDRGHVCPSADRTAGTEDNSATFLMTNMIPQAPDLNRIVWKDFESFERNLAAVQDGKELYIIAGQFGSGGTSACGSFSEIPLVSEAGNGRHIAVPAFCWKIILVLPKGEEDLSRITAETPVISVCMPNAQGLQNAGGWKHYLCTVDYIEEQCGWDFFTALPDEIEDKLESRIFTDGSGAQEENLW